MTSHDEASKICRALGRGVARSKRRAQEWSRKGAEAGLPKSMFSFGCSLDMGQGVAAPDYLAAGDWYRRAADAGDWGAANNLSHMYAVGRGWAWKLMPARSSSTL